MVVLRDKGTSVYRVQADDTVASAVSTMNEHRIGSVMVIEDEKAVGIFTERDVLTRVVSSGIDPRATLVRDVMTKEFQHISEATSLEQAMALMTEKRVRHLPILSGDELKGMVSIGDVTRWLLHANEMEKDTLKSYFFPDYSG